MRTKTMLCAGVALLAVSAVQATETLTYTYDAEGRLTLVSRSGSVNNGNSSGYSHDRADNRTALTVNGATPPPPPPSPPPPPPNSPPVANTDNGGSMAKCTFKTVTVTSNDTDPESNYPLTVTNAVGNGGLSANVVSSTQVEIESGSSTGAKTVTYTVADSLGATANGTINITVSGGSCDN